MLDWLWYFRVPPLPDVIRIPRFAHGQGKSELLFQRLSTRMNGLELAGINSALGRCL